MQVRTRIAPSPTGDPHIGNFYSALLDYALAKKYNGQFVVRIEDTDRTRLVPGAEEKFFAALDWLGLSEDESPRKGGPHAPYRQSQRLHLYQKYTQELLEKGAAYPCFCESSRLQQIKREQQKRGQPPRYDQHCLRLPASEVKRRLSNNEPHVVRLKVPPTGQTSFNDLLRGEISFENRLIDDQILLKSDGFPAYHLAVVVDDHLMQISHIIRAEEWISSTPKHILLYQALGWKAPQFLHHPLLRNKDKSKMSKRKNPTSVLWYREQGFLPEALINYLTHLGWTHPDEREIYSLDEFVRTFSIKNLKTTAPIFDLQKLKWINAQYIKALPAKELADQISAVSIHRPEPNAVEPVVPLVRSRIKTLTDYDLVAGFLHKRPKTRPEKQNAAQLKLVYSQLQQETSWNANKIQKDLKDVATANKIEPRDLFMEVRTAISGSRVSLPLFESLQQLGKEETLKRLQLAMGLS